MYGGYYETCEYIDDEGNVDYELWEEIQFEKEYGPFY